MEFVFQTIVYWLTVKASRFPYINVESTDMEVSNKNFQVVFKTVTLSSMILIDNEVNVEL